MKIKILNSGITKDVEKGTKLIDLLNQDKTYFAAKINGRVHELAYKISTDCEIEFLDIKDSNVSRIYEASLRFIFSMAINKLFPKKNLIFNYSVSRSILAVFKDEKISAQDLKLINQEVKKIIDADFLIERKLLNIDETKSIYEKQNLKSKLSLLNYRSEEYVNIYKCDNFYNYMYSQMVYSTGYLKEYKTFLFDNGFIIQYPRAEAGGIIPEFNASKGFANALKNATAWNKITKISTISEMNEAAVSFQKKKDLINICEIRHSSNLFELAQIINKKIDKVRLIAIAGPSSSGKTTFSNRLRLTLQSLGLNPLMISIDDYYLPKDQVPLDENGEKDLENIEALDIKRFSRDMKSLTEYKPITLPRYNFKKGIVEEGEKIIPEKGQPIIIEGIHALNERLTNLIARENKFNIYIAPQSQLHIDNQNPISITDLRLLRRITRDAKFRNSSATETLSMWPSVRRGEFKWIYPFQDQADYVFSTELTYEFMVLKKHALRNLAGVPRDSKYFIVANRLVKFLKYFIDIEDELIPCNSLLREFIGGSNI